MIDTVLFLTRHICKCIFYKVNFRSGPNNICKYANVSFLVFISGSQTGGQPVFDQEEKYLAKEYVNESNSWVNSKQTQSAPLLARNSIFRLERFVQKAK